jgi:LPS-assembly lipoprotein
MRVSFRLYDNKGQNWIVPTEINLKREVSYNDTNVLAKDYEEAQLYKDMQSDAVQQVVRRLSGAKAPL